MLKFNSESILSGIHKLMMTRNNEAVSEMVQDMAEGSTIYQDIRLLSHYSGEIVVSRFDEPRGTLSEEDDSCAICHGSPGPLTTSDTSLDEVVGALGGDRTLRVVTPIVNETSCSEADCHAHEESGPTLGFLETEYSLEKIDALLLDINSSFVVAAVTAILLGAMALWIMFKQSLDKPIRHMISGIRAITGEDLSFRFKTDRKDEFGQVEKSFNQMAARIWAQQTELRDAREYLEGVVENSADFIITVNPEGVIEMVNRGAEQGLGYQREELIGKPIDLLFARPERTRYRYCETRRPGQRNQLRNALSYKGQDDQARSSDTVSPSRSRRKRHRHDWHQQRHYKRERPQESPDAIRGGRRHRSGSNGDSAQHQEHVEHADGRLVPDAPWDNKGQQGEDGGGTRNDRRWDSDHRRPLREHDEIRQDMGDSSPKPPISPRWSRRPARPSTAECGRQAGDDSVQRSPTTLPLVSCDARLTRMALMDIATNALDACHWMSYGDGRYGGNIEFNVYLEAERESIVVENPGQRNRHDRGNQGKYLHAVF